MSEFGGPEVSDITKKGGETIAGSPVTLASEKPVTPQTTASIQGEINPAAPRTVMTEWEKALQPRPSEVLRSGITAMQGPIAEEPSHEPAVSTTTTSNGTTS